MNASGILDHVEIRAISCAVPENRIENDFFLARFGDGVSKFAKMTGVQQRYVTSSWQTASDLSFAAAIKIFEDGKIERDSVDAILFVTQTPDYVLPATACVLHHRLDLKKACLAFDVNLGCSGFAYGVFLAASLCHREGIHNVLLCGGDTVSKLVSPTDQSAAMLFGDAGFAALISYNGNNTSSWHYLYGTDGHMFKSIIVPSGAQRNPCGSREIHECGEGILRSDYDLYMDGTEVFNFTISEVPESIKRLMVQANRTPENTDFLVLHQANLFILKQIARMTCFPMTKVPVSMDRYGNTSVSSIPITLCDMASRAIDTDIFKVVMAGFGVGLSWGVVSLSISRHACLPILKTANGYAEGALDVN